MDLSFQAAQTGGDIFGEIYSLVKILKQDINLYILEHWRHLHVFIDLLKVQGILTNITRVFSFHFIDPQNVCRDELNVQIIIGLFENLKCINKVI